jgi:multimeric flavodoxin WrbA
MLNELNFELCRGCYSCVLRGEDKCPIKDDRDMIIKAMLYADGIVFASPVYSHMISATMKNYFDRLGFYAHRPRFFDKYAMSIVTCSGHGAEEAIKYMDKMLGVFGFNLVSPLELQFQPGKIPEKNKIENHKKTIEAFNALIARIEKGGRDKLSLNMLIPFKVFKYVSEIGKEVMKADYEYYKDKTDFYYDTKIPFFKKMITKKVVKKIIDEFD